MTVVVHCTSSEKIGHRKDKTHTHILEVHILQEIENTIFRTLAGTKNGNQLGSELQVQFLGSYSPIISITIKEVLL